MGNVNFTDLSLTSQAARGHSNHWPTPRRPGGGDRVRSFINTVIDFSRGLQSSCVKAMTRCTQERAQRQPRHKLVSTYIGHTDQSHALAALHVAAQIAEVG